MPSNNAVAKPEQVIVEKVQMPSRQPLDLGQRGVDGLCVERPAALEERLLVAEVAHVGAPSRDDDGVRDEIEMPFDQITPDRRHAGERSDLRSIDAIRGAAPEIGEESRPRVLAGSEKDRVRMPGSLFRQRRDVEASKRHMRAPSAVVIREAIRAVRGGDVDLNDDQVGRVVQVEPLHVLVLNFDVILTREKPRQRGQAERREE